MTHSEIIQIAAKWLKKHECNTLLSNCPLVITELKSFAGEIPDIIGFSSSQSTIIEVKTSVADFKRDAEKFFRKRPESGMGEFRLFCCPEGIITPGMLPIGWGLLYVINGKITMIEPPVWVSANLEAERTLLMSIIRRNNYYKKIAS